MNPTVKLGMHFHNKFELSLIDAASGTVKKKAYAENVVLDRFWTYIGASSLDRPFVNICLGTGSGTPSSADSGLFAFAFYAAANVLVGSSKAYPTSYITKSATFPASTSYIGTLTEVGIAKSSTNSTVFTHAMLTDAEGNPTTINKTELDLLIVTATLYCTILSSVDGFYLIPADSNNIIKWLFGEDSTRYAPLYPNIPSSNYNGMAKLSLLPSCVPADNDARNAHSSAISTNCESTSSWSAANKTLTIISNRVGTTVGNTRYYHGLALNGQGHIQFPNATVFPNYEITGVPVGTGDGTTSAFKVPIPLFVKDTDKVYKNGVQLTRGTDYTIENNSNPDRLCNLTPGNFSNFDPYSGSFLLPGVGTYGSLKIYYPLVCDSTYESYTNPYSIPVPDGIFAMDASHPAIFELAYIDPIIGKKCNYFRVGHLEFKSSYNVVNVSGAVITLSYSNDKINWTEAGSLTLNGNANSNYGTILFDAVEATYWKVALDTSGMTNEIFKSLMTNNLLFLQTVEAKNAWSLGYTNPTGLVFTTPPADGDVITMDCTIDRPYKNENFVIDTSMTVQLA